METSSCSASGQSLSYRVEYISNIPTLIEFIEVPPPPDHQAAADSTLVAGTGVSGGRIRWANAL